MIDTDVLMITYNRPAYVERSLPRLLDSCLDRARVWIWHNGCDERTLELVERHLSHPAIHEFHHSTDNVGLRAPTNWLWRNATGVLVGKVDDDCLVSAGWCERLARAHEDVDVFGVLGSWRYPDEDFCPELASKKIRSFSGGHRLLQNLWVQGSGYLMKRELVDRYGGLRDGQTFTQYCKRLAVSGAVNGWYFPFVREEHMDDPRSPYSLLRTDADILESLPLSAQRNGVTTVAAWTAQLRRSALVAQTAPYRPAQYRGLRRHARNLRRRLTRTDQW